MSTTDQWRDALRASPPVKIYWRCFHCDAVMTDERSAREHFGATEESQPACVVKAGAEGSLVRALREAEEAAADAWHMIHNETTDAARAYYAQRARHSQQLMAAEEAGYERGLRDGMALRVSDRSAEGDETKTGGEQ